MVCVGFAGWSENKHACVCGCESGGSNCFEEGCYFSLNFSVPPWTTLHRLRRHNIEPEAKMAAVTLQRCRMLILAQCPSAVLSVWMNMANKHLCVFCRSSAGSERGRKVSAVAGLLQWTQISLQGAHLHSDCLNIHLWPFHFIAVHLHGFNWSAATQEENNSAGKVNFDARKYISQSCFLFCLSRQENQQGQQRSLHPSCWLRNILWITANISL